ncbi:MAG: hypothetical protein SFV17_10230 [Candidatus Obscuribacter sp.]|nr:hypothetical protein [Candidatus Obscuribacter sp.]
MELEKQPRAVKELATEIARQVVADLVSQELKGGADHVEVFSLRPNYAVSVQCLELKGWRAFFASWFRPDYYTRTYKATPVQVLTKHYLQENGYHCRWIERYEVWGYQSASLVASLLVAPAPVLLDREVAAVHEDLGDA